jgi:mRNA-degrading endonuclease YafQ of YafQ-DinJ toxin-antitoxin module
MYRLVETVAYRKKALKFFRKHPALLKKYEKTIVLLGENPYHPSLRLHKLRGELKEYYSVSIDMEYRIILDFVVIDKKIFLLDIGSHSEVY